MCDEFALVEAMDLLQDTLRNEWRNDFNSYI